MPPGTKLRNLRVNDSLWLRAKAVAESRGESLSDVLRTALEEYVQRHDGSADRRTMMGPTEIDLMLKHATAEIRDDLLDIRNGERTDPGKGGIGQ